MVAFGGELIVAGKDFDESRVVAERLGTSAAIIWFRRFIVSW